MKMQLCVKVSHSLEKTFSDYIVFPVVTVDKSKDRTRMLKLDEDEFLEVTNTIIIVLYMYFVLLQPIELPLANLMQHLNFLKKSYGFVVEAKLYMFALGLQIGIKH